MSDQKDKPTVSISLEFLNAEGAHIPNVPIMPDRHVPIPSVGDEVVFHDEVFRVKARRFSYVVGSPDQGCDVKVVFTCDRA